MKKGTTNPIGGPGQEGAVGLECMTVAQLLEGWPAVIPVFLRHHMSCVGCNMARFENLADAARIYSLDVDAFFFEIRGLI